MYETNKQKNQIILVMIKMVIIKATHAKPNVTFCLQFQKKTLTQITDMLLTSQIICVPAKNCPAAANSPAA